MRVFDYEGELTADYEAAVAKALPADICPLVEFWHKLAEAIEGYIVMTENRTRRPPKGELEPWRNVASLVDDLGIELRKMRHDPTWGDRCIRALSALTPVKDMAAAYRRLRNTSPFEAHARSQQSTAAILLQRRARSLAPFGL